MSRATAAAVARILIAVLACVAITVTITDEDGKRTITVHAHVAKAPPGDLNLEAPLDNGGQPSPATISRNVINEHSLVPPIPVAGAQIVHCSTLFGGHLYSSRGGIRPTMFVLHYTAGNGTAESIDSYFRSTRAGSATYLLEPSGHCRQEVPESEKPWTQLAANPYSISVEIVTTGWNVSRAQWLAMPIFSRGYLAALMRDSMHRNGLPIRRVDPFGCNFTAGYTDHNALECSNDHTDVLPNFPWDVLAKQLHGPDPNLAPKAAQHACGNLRKYRARLRSKGHLGHYGSHQLHRSKVYFAKKHEHGRARYHCPAKGPASRKV